MLSRKRFKKRTVKCPYPRCNKLVVNGGGLTQHIQASHVAAERHPAEPPPPIQDHEEAPFDDEMGGPQDECVGQQPGPFTNFHPIIDGKSPCFLDDMSPQYYSESMRTHIRHCI